ncbi:hypothetical protein BOVATA_042910 [Babesia ovata]|uniref:GAF domain-containing protein n=1 Tax=Babesia ovata TaxID=189622 RepID=A0A2H6KII0_9APIC|nr:uncharacterized protein BOVATA_042910 [Babesia ovata]GBE62798.1 hypothetical protein BOVATA_042910 [Babesia ovata]
MMEGFRGILHSNSFDRQSSLGGSLQHSGRSDSQADSRMLRKQGSSSNNLVQRYDLSSLTKDQLLVLMCFSNAIMSQNLPVKCILMTLKALKTNLGAELVEMCYPDKDSGEWVHHSVGKDGVLHKKNIPTPDAGAYHHAFVSGTHIRIDSCADNPIYDKQLDQHTDIELKNLLVCPLVDSRKLVWGVTGIANCPKIGLGGINYHMQYSVSTPVSELVGGARQASESNAATSAASTNSLSTQNSLSASNSASNDGACVFSDASAISREEQGDHVGVDGPQSSKTVNGIDELWDDSAITFALQVCDIGGQCISNAIGWRQLDATRDKANGLLTLMHSLFADRLGIQSCVVALTTHARKLIQAERCTVYIVDRAHEQLWSISSDDGSQVIIPLGRGCASDCVATGDVIVIENAFEDERFEPQFDSRDGVEIRNVAWVPIKNGDCNRVLAVIEVINKQADELLHFGEDDLRLLEIFSAIVGPQLEKSDFAISVSRPVETEAGLAFKTHPQTMMSASRHHIAEPCIPETEEE